MIKKLFGDAFRGVLFATTPLFLAQCAVPALAQPALGEPAADSQCPFLETKDLDVPAKTWMRELTQSEFIERLKERDHHWVDVTTKLYPNSRLLRAVEPSGRRLGEMTQCAQSLLGSEDHIWEYQFYKSLESGAKPESVKEWESHDRSGEPADFRFEIGWVVVRDGKVRVRLEKSHWFAGG